MRHEEFSWTSFDGLEIFAQSWAPAGGAKAAIALVHGVGEHSGRYPWLVEAFTDAGYAVSAFDGRGHGRSAGPRVHTPSYDALLRDIDLHLAQTGGRFAGIPLFLYGHSFGGAQVLCHVLKHAPRLAGVVASSPGLASGVHQSAAKILAGRLLSRVAPTMRIALGSPMESLSHDAAWRDATKRDPLYMTTLSARSAMEQVRTNAWILEQTRFPLPLLVMQGTEDRHVDPQTSIAFARGLTGEVTLKVWEGLGHELHNETDRKEVLQFARAWLDARAR